MENNERKNERKQKKINNEKKQWDNRKQCKTWFL